MIFRTAKLSTHKLSKTACAAAFLYAALAYLSPAWGQVVFSIDFSNPPNGEYSARGQGINGAGTAYWTLGTDAFAAGFETVSEANGWKVVGDPMPFSQISLVGNINSTTYLADTTQYQEEALQNWILAVDTGGALRTNNTGGVTTAPARRVGIGLDDDLDPALLTNDYLTILDQTVRWASESDGTGLTVGYVTADGDVSGSLFDSFWVNRLQSAGNTVVQLGEFEDPPANLDLAILSDNFLSGNVGTRYTDKTYGVINYEQALHDEMGVANGGGDGNTIDSIRVEASGHPIVDGFTGMVEISNPSQSGVHLPGLDDAPGATVVATRVTMGPGQINSLAEVDALKAGTIPSDMFTGTIDQADIYDSGTNFGRWGFDNFPVGTSVEGDDFAVVNTGTFNVAEQRIYHFAITGDDGGRLRIDQNGDGILDADDDVIVDDTTHGVEDRFGSVELPVGMHAFEWVGFERGGGAGWELSVALDPATIGDPFGGDDGTFFAGADMDAAFAGGADAGNPRRIETRPINVAGGSDLRVSVDLAASDPGPWEDVDFLRVLVDEDADGPAAPTLLTEFFGMAGALSNGTTDLGLTFQNFQFPLTGVIPADAQQISLIVEALSTAGDELVGIDNLALLGMVPPPPMGLAGDYNDDGVVNAADYVIFRNNLGQDASAFAPGSRDPNNSGPVNAADYDFWVANFGNTASGGSAVPEPMSAWLLGVGLGLLHLTSQRKIR